MSMNPNEPLDSAQSWELLAEQLDQFITAWDSETEPPDPGRFLPAGEPIRGLVLVELLKVDLEYRLERGVSVSLEQYLERFPELNVDESSVPGAPPCDLVYEEFHLRRAAGQTVDSAEYFSRFPTIEDSLRRLMNVDVETATRTCGAMRSVQGIEAGQRLDDFELILKLGQGAFASVFMARQISMQRVVALKVSADRGDEPQTLAQLEHPGIVRVYDQRSLAAPQLRLLYMQLAGGGTLHEVTTSRIPIGERSGAIILRQVDQNVEQIGAASDDSAMRRWLSQATWPEAVCRLGSQLAKALHYAHEKGILHRDVKPANILLAADGSPKLADFNISFNSKLDGASAAAYFGGSLAYMSPEQLDACNPDKPLEPDELDGRADLFSLAVVLWELLHGVRPFPEDRSAQSWSNSLASLAAGRKTQPDVPSGNEPTRSLSLVLRKCLSNQPGERQQTGEQLARELYLCSQAKSRQLLQGVATRWRNFFRERSAWVLALSILGPHGLAGAFNYWFNKREIIDVIPGAQEPFQRIQLVVNTVAFGSAILLFAYLIAPLAIGVRKRTRGERLPNGELVRLRRRAVALPLLSAVVGAVGWLVAGIVYPVALHFSVEGLTPADVRLIYQGFLTSLSVCGLIAAAYPFFAIAYWSVHELYPALLEPSSIEADEEFWLRRLGRSSGVFLLTAAGVPMTAALAVMVASTNNYAPALLIGAGLVGLAVSALTYRVVIRDSAALLNAVRPTENWGAETETSTL